MIPVRSQNIMETKHSFESESWIVEDDAECAAIIKLLLESAGCSASIFNSGRLLLDAIQQRESLPDLICLDLTLPDFSGLDLLGILKNQDPYLPIIVITSNTSTESIEKAIQLGAYDYLPKNSEKTKFTTTFHRALEYRKLNRTLFEIQKHDHFNVPQFGIWGDSPLIKAVINKVKQMAQFDVNVLVSGESGTGKELVAKALHLGSPRKTGPFVAINCAVLPTELIASELFGHERGSFTGADSRHIGAFERANGGTLFLDEIGELDLSVQAKLLRAIQERQFLRVGGKKEIPSNFRLVTATNRKLTDEITKGRFRSDLYYRLAVTEIELPPLRSRKGDIALLSHHFVREIGAQMSRQVVLSNEAIETLNSYDWPGNIRELQNVIHSALIQCEESTLHSNHLPSRIRERTNETNGSQVAKISDAAENHFAKEISLPLSLEEQEKIAILNSLRSSGGRILSASKVLGISRATFYRKLQKYNLSPRGQF